MSFIYSKKRMGSRILPCGTAHVICILSDKVSPILLFGVYFSGMIQTIPLQVLLYHNFLVCLIRFDG